VDQVKFVKPVVAKAAEVTEEPPKIVKSKKKIRAETIKGDPDAVLSVVLLEMVRNKLLKRITKSTTMLVSRLNLISRRDG
jgi:hypothetical protein